MAFADAGYTGDTLVVLSLRGGFDGLSAIAPIGDPDYYKARPTIALPKSQVIAGDGTFGLHPALAPLLPLWQGGKLAAVHAVGQPNPTRSHFAAMEEMENAAPGTSIRSGWLDRMLGLTGATGPLAGVSIGGGDAGPAVRGAGAGRLDGVDRRVHAGRRLREAADRGGAAGHVRGRPRAPGRAGPGRGPGADRHRGAARRRVHPGRTAPSTRPPSWAPRCATWPG